MKRSTIIFTAVLVMLQFCCSTIWARPITVYEAQQAVTGWLRVDPQPLETALGGQVAKVETFKNENGKVIYYVVYLEPAGFVIMPADDLVEPIVGFADDGKYDPSPNNPLGALVTQDLNGRIALVRDVKGLEASGRMEEAAKLQAKWGRLISLADSNEEDVVIEGLGSISDVRVAPLVRSRWGQGNMCVELFGGARWYNYYTSYGYPCGCVATAMAQLMRYYEYPTSGIGVHGFTITVNGEEYTKYTRGGDGNGGPYKWSLMRYDPDCTDVTNDDEAEATGALCYDAGISVNMSYSSSGSATDTLKAKDGLTTTFKYANAIKGYNSGNNIGQGLIGMVNPNLDAKCPVILGITGPGGGHAVVCDGYGYESLTMYHHLNMGWEGSDDAWYNLPNVESDPGPYNSIYKCVYNIRPTGEGDGEVISGRVCYYVFIFGFRIPMPIPNATVYISTNPPPPPPQTSMRGLDSNSVIFPIFTSTDSKGIYAFSDVNSNTTYYVTSVVRGYASSTQAVTVGRSQDNHATSGNVWGVDFTLTRLDLLYVDDDAPLDPGPGNAGVSDPLEDGSIQHPFDSIREAIDVSINGNEIEVAPGTYNECFVDFKGKAVRLYSSGGPDVTIIEYTGMSGWEHVLCQSGEDANTILEGFTVGGCMLNYQSNPTVTNCIFTGNSADGYGGMLNESSNPTVTNCIFTGITPLYVNGGGMYNHNNSNPTVTDCNFVSNSGTLGGGMCNDNSSPTVTDCMFSGNTASEHGGGMHNLLSSPTLIDCTFSGNSTSTGSGGGMCNFENSNPTVSECTFSDNEAGFNGGGICNNGSNPIVTNCTFIANSALGDGGGGMMNFHSSTTMTNCVFLNNYAANVGGIMLNVYGSPTVTNCTFSGNSAVIDGGGMYNDWDSYPTLTNCILWGDEPNEIVNDHNSNTTVTYSDVQGLWGGVGNIDTDPCFVDGDNPDPNLVNLRLLPDSPCIDAGNNTAVPASVLKDVAGKLRFADDPCTSDTGNAGMTGRPVVDMGAYEFQCCGTTSQNLLANPGFEVGDATGWVTNWGFNLTAVTDQIHNGNYSGLASDRTASWQGAWQSLLGLMDDGKTYRISGWVRLQNATSDYVALTIKKTDSAGTNYYGIDNATGHNDQWVHLDGTLALDVVGQLTDLYVYFEGPAPGVNFYVDSAAVTEVMGDMNHNGCVDFIDFGIFASYYGFDCSTQDCGRANLNDCDNTINVLDIVIFCNNWLAGTEPEL